MAWKALHAAAPPAWLQRLPELLCMLTVACWALPALAVDSELPPDTDAALIISAQPGTTALEHDLHLDMVALRRLPRTELLTITPWKSELQRFAGVTIHDLLTHLGSDASALQATGFDDYRFTLANIDFEKYPVLIAWQHNGKPMTLRELGPLRIVFPLSDYPELDTPVNRFSAVWQLVHIRLL